MLVVPIDFDAPPANADQDVEVLGVYTVGGAIAVMAGGFGLVMAIIEDLPRRERWFGIGSAIATGLLGVVEMVKPVDTAAVLRHRLSPWVLPALSLLGIAASGAERSPMFYPGLILTGFGGGRLGRARVARGEPSPGAILGTASAAGYVAVVAGARQLRAERWDTSLLWNLGACPLFFAAAAIGGELGDLALAVRRIERTRKRDKEALALATDGTRGDLARVAADVGHTAAELEQTLLRIAAPRRSLPDSSSREVRAAVEEVRAEIQHHMLGPLLVAAANEEEMSLVDSLEAILDVYREGWREEGISIIFDSRLPVDMHIHPRVTSVLVRATKVALDNSHKHQRERLSTIGLTVALEEGRSLVLRIVDDGGADAPKDDDWGTGLTETDAHLQSIDGRMGLHSTGKGVELWVRAPTTLPAPHELDRHVPLGRRIDESLSRCAGVIRPATWVNGVACCLTASRKRSGVAHAALFTALVCVDRLWNRSRPGDSRRAMSIAPAVSLLWPSGGRITSGWAGLETISLGAYGHAREARTVGMLAFVATSLSALRVKRTVPRARVVENVAFPIVCTLSGLAAAHGRRLLEEAERDSLGLRERADLIERLARTVRLHHDLIKPLRRSRAWYDEGIVESDDGRRLLSLSRRIDDLTRGLLALIVLADPIRDLRDHLRLRLEPTPVTVSGIRPKWTSRRADAVAVERAREHLGLVALADELADLMLARFPPKINGRPRLESLHIDISPLDEEELCVSLRAFPPAGDRNEGLHTLEIAVRGLSGRMVWDCAPDSLTFVLPAVALAAL